MSDEETNLVKAHSFHLDVKLRRLFEDPDNPHPGENLFQAISYCCGHNLPLPSWVREGFRRGYNEYREYRGTTEEAFGLEPRKHLKAKQKRSLESLVWQTVNAFHADGHPKDEGTFALVGEALSKKIRRPSAYPKPDGSIPVGKGVVLSGGEVRRMYYEFLNLIKDSESWTDEVMEYDPD